MTRRQVEKRVATVLLLEYSFPERSLAPSDRMSGRRSRAILRPFKQMVRRPSLSVLAGWEMIRRNRSRDTAGSLRANLSACDPAEKPKGWTC